MSLRAADVSAMCDSMLVGCPLQQCVLPVLWQGLGLG